MFITSLKHMYREAGICGLESTGEQHSFVAVVDAKALEASMKLPAYALLWPDGVLELSLDGARATVGPHSFLVANPGQTLRAGADTAPATQLTTIGLATDLLATSYQALRTVSRRLLRLDRWPVVFHNDPRPDDACVSPVVQRIHSAFRLGVRDREWLDKQLRILAERLLFAEHKRHARADSRKPRKGALASRLTRVRDYIDTSYDQPLRLEQMARVVYASPYHFLRVFKNTYGQTPHQYLIRRRLEASKDLLETTDLPIKEISERVGFQNANGFYKAFKRCYECSPANFRQANEE